MIPILDTRELAPNIYEMVVLHPKLAAKAMPGHFVIVMADEQGERIPLTIADLDRAAGTITLVVMAVGTSTQKIVARKKDDELYALIGPLGHASPIENFGTVILVAGGVGAAPVYPIAKALKEAGNHVITIQGARNSELLFWIDRMRAVSDRHIIMTDDGSAGRKGLVTEPLKELLQSARAAGVNPLVAPAMTSFRRENVWNDVVGDTPAGLHPPLLRVYAIGPAVMMKFCAETCRPFGVPTIASLNTTMIDGTGMCGGCRVRVGGETKFTCIDGPEFDALAIDWDLLLSRQKIYHEHEQCSLSRHTESTV